MNMIYIVYEKVKDMIVLYGIYNEKNLALHKAKKFWNTFYKPYSYIIQDDCLFRGKDGKTIYFQSIISNKDFWNDV